MPLPKYGFSLLSSPRRADFILDETVAKEDRSSLCILVAIDEHDPVFNCDEAKSRVKDIFGVKKFHDVKVVMLRSLNFTGSCAGFGTFSTRKQRPSPAHSSFSSVTTFASPVVQLDLRDSFARLGSSLSLIATLYGGLLTSAAGLSQREGLVVTWS
jgi:hypothetical protein